MDLLDRARALSSCPLFASLAPAVLIRLAERATPNVLAAGDRRTTEDTIWVVASGALSVSETAADSAARRAARGTPVRAGGILGMVRVVRRQTPVVEAVADEPATLIGLAVDDVRDILEEDPAALGALASQLARLLLEGAS